MLALILQAINSALRPDPHIPLTEKHLQTKKKHLKINTKPRIIPKKTRRMKGVYEHKDTPIHHE